MKKNEKLFPAVDLCSVFSCYLWIPPEFPAPLTGHKVNADKFHDLTNAAEINTVESCWGFIRWVTVWYVLCGIFGVEKMYTAKKNRDI